MSEEMRARLAKLNRMWLWRNLTIALGFAFMGPLVIAIHVANLLDNVTTRNWWLVAFSVAALGYSLWLTWDATRYGKQLRLLQSDFDKRLEALVAETSNAFSKGMDAGRECMKDTTRNMLREIGQSFADTSGAGFSILFEEEEITCLPTAGSVPLIQPKPPAPTRH